MSAIGCLLRNSLRRSLRERGDGGAGGPIRGGDGGAEARLLWNLPRVDNDCLLLLSASVAIPWSEGHAITSVLVVLCGYGFPNGQWRFSGLAPSNM